MKHFICVDLELCKLSFITQASSHNYDSGTSVIYMIKAFLFAHCLKIKIAIQLNIASIPINMICSSVLA